MDQQAMKICLAEVARCQMVSPRPNFIILLGNRYGWRPLPYEIAADEFERILPFIPKEEQPLIQEWYQLDENAVPPVCFLQRRTGAWVDPDVWDTLERQMHTLLETAARNAGLPEAELIKYQASATEQEIIHGAFQAVNAREHIFCFTRETTEIPPDQRAGGFLDLVKGKLDETAAKQLRDLKARLKDVLKENYHEYTAQWGDGDPTQNHIDQFCKDVYDCLARIILDELESQHELAPIPTSTVHIPTDAALDVEGLTHHKFAEERLEFFVGRTQMLAKIAAHLQAGGRRSLAIIGAGGTGKSALMAKAVEQAWQTHPQAAIIYRFIGATPGSSDGRSLLEDLCKEISRRYGTSETDIPMEYRDLVPELGKRMGLATADKPLLLFLDSLDQLSTSQAARSLVWLPNELPEHVSVVLSSRDKEDTYDSLAAKQVSLEILGGLSRVEGDDLLTLWLKSRSVSRDLQPTQRNEVLDKFMCKDLPDCPERSAGNPLYLKLAFEEARLWRSGSGQPPERLEPFVSGIIEKNMIHRLADESNHGEELVSHALGYLAASRYGLAEDELLDLLSRDVQVYQWFFEKGKHLPSDLVQCAIQYRPAELEVIAFENKISVDDKEAAAVAWLSQILKNSREAPEQVSEFLKQVLPTPDGPRLPVVLWSRLSFDLAPYLTERMLDGSPLLDFYHRELGDVSRAVFLKDGQAETYHERLADYFRFKSDPAADRTWTGHHLHGLSELPYHLTVAGKIEDAYHTLTDFKFLEHKAEEVGILRGKDERGNEVITSQGVLQLQEDMQRLLAAMPGGEGDMGERAPLILTALETSKGLMVYCPVCNKASPIKRDDLDKKIQCPQETCKAPIKLNPFTVKREI